MSCVVAFIVASLTMVATSSAWAQPVAAADAARFDVLEYEVEGNTVLAARVVEQALLPQMGPQRSLAQVEAARAALEKAYQDAGYL